MSHGLKGELQGSIVGEVADDPFDGVFGGEDGEDDGGGDKGWLFFWIGNGDKGIDVGDVWLKLSANDEEIGAVVYGAKLVELVDDLGEGEPDITSNYSYSPPAIYPNGVNIMLKLTICTASVLLLHHFQDLR